MPTYEYLCNQCEHAFEVVQSFSDSAIEQCPKCDGRVRKVYNNVGVVFKGSGFYKTDSRSAPLAKPESKVENKPATVNNKLEKKESTPAKKNDTKSN
jgi:putative FmdB family regulatory protein